MSGFRLNDFQRFAVAGLLSCAVGMGIGYLLGKASDEALAKKLRECETALDAEAGR